MTAKIGLLGSAVAAATRSRSKARISANRCAIWRARMPVPSGPEVYGLVPTNNKTEVGIFRVDKLGGKIWQCFSGNSKTVCAPPAP